MGYYKEFLEVAKKITDECDVCALLLIGKTSTTSEEDFHKLNDIDLLVVYDKNVGYERQVEDIKEVPFDISFVSIYDLITQIESKSQLWINMVIGSKIYYSKNELIFGIIDRVKDIHYSGTQKLSDEAIRWIRFNITQKHIEIKNRIDDVINSNYLMSKLFDRALEDYYSLNKLWYPNPKYLIEKLEVTDEKLCKLAKDFIFECSVGRRSIILKEILEYILEPFGGLLYNWPKGPYEITL